MDCDDCKRGAFIALEGIDGSGTTVQRDLLVAELAEQGVTVHGTEEPTREILGVIIREALRGERKLAPRAMALLFAADRVEHAEHIEELVANGVTVVCDRYVWSSYAYQGLATGAPEWVDSINEQSMQPDLVVYCQVDPQVAAERREARGEGDELYDMMETQQLVAREYDHLATDSQRQAEAFGPNAGIAPVLVVDASKDIQAVHHDIYFGVENFLVELGIMEPDEGE